MVIIEEIKIERPEPLQPCWLVIESRLQSETESSNFETGVNIPEIPRCFPWLFTVVINSNRLFDMVIYHGYIYIYIPYAFTIFANSRINPETWVN